MCENGKKCIGIDVGGTSVKIGLFETDGTLLFKWEVPTRKEEGGRYILEDVAASIREVLREKEIHFLTFWEQDLVFRDRSCRMATWRSA